MIKLGLVTFSPRYCSKPGGRTGLIKKEESEKHYFLKGIKKEKEKFHIDGSIFKLKKFFVKPRSLKTNLVLEIHMTFKPFQSIL